MTVYQGPMLRRPFKMSPIITQVYGPTLNASEPSLYGYPHFHTGVDYAMPQGSCIISPGKGVIDRLGWDDTGYGNLLVIKHGPKTYSYLGHLLKAFGQVGDEVGALELVALSGSTGNSTGPHLHWGVMHGGLYINPWEALDPAYR